MLGCTGLRGARQWRRQLSDAVGPRARRRDVLTRAARLRRLEPRCAPPDQRGQVLRHFGFVAADLAVRLLHLLDRGCTTAQLGAGRPGALEVTLRAARTFPSPSTRPSRAPPPASCRGASCCACSFSICFAAALSFFASSGPPSSPRRLPADWCSPCGPAPCLRALGVGIGDPPVLALAAMDAARLR